MSVNLDSVNIDSNEYVITKDSFKHVGLLKNNSRQEMIQGEGKSFLYDALNRFKKNKGAVVGLILLIIILIMAIIGPIISHYVNGHRFYTIYKGELNYLPNSKYWFGSDPSGRDLFTRVWKGTQVSLQVAVIAVSVDMVIGVTYGVISGYLGGKVDLIMQRLVEILNGIPNLVVVTLFILVFQPGMVTIILALMLTGWIGMSRTVRAQVLKLREQEFVLAADVLGAKKFKIIFSEMIPNVLPHMIVMTMFSIPSAIFYEAYLAFIGLGFSEPMASLGNLINTGSSSLLTYPHVLIYPTVVLSILMLSFNLIADGLRDAFDPKMKGF